MLRNIEPSNKTLGRLRENWDFHHALPEIQVVNRALLVAHINVERKKINGSECSTTEDLKESRQAIARLNLWK